MIPTSDLFDQSTMAALLDHDPVVQDYRAFFALLDWSLVEHWQAQRSARGRPAHPESAYLKAFLVRIREGLLFTSQLRRFLLKHPLLVIELGFRLELAPQAPYGFLPEQTLPCEQWLREKLRTLDQGLLQQLLHATVTALQAEIPGLGETVAFDVKHIYAWVKQNNERVYVKDRYDKAQRLAGDPDCRLGVKRSSNQDASLESGQPQQPSTHAQAQSSKAHTRNKPLHQDPPEKAQPSKAHKEYIWGYGSGVAAATDPVYGDVVLAEYTLPFNEADVTYYRPLFQRVVVATNQLPTYVTADAAFDYWYVYETAAHRHGIAAIPLNTHGHEEVPRDPDGTPRCWAGLRMHPTSPFQHTNGFRAQRFRCPLLFPTRTGQACAHAQFAKGKGCVKDPNWEKGGLMRALLDRTGPLYHAIYTQRTTCERINSQAQALGIERPKVRNGYAVKNLNTLIYLVINVRALAKAKSINKGLLQMN
jgi:Transposase DDE domain